jgi:DDE family transposase
MGSLGRLLSTADRGGSHGDRSRLWKTAWPTVANATGLEIAVCHLPPGTSQWNTIAHRLLSPISQNWRGTPLVSHAVMVNLRASTTTRTGLMVRCALDTHNDPKGISISDKELE